MEKYKAWVYDYDAECRIDFESETSCCASCVWDDEIRYIDDPCCCRHQAEWSNRKECKTERVAEGAQREEAMNELCGL